MARVVVTGGSGKLGRACVADLVAHDWDVVVFDRIRPSGLLDDVTAAITYLPVNEEYDPRPESTYSLTKTLEETMARHLCRWDPELKMIGLRFSNVMEPQDYEQFPSFDADPRARKWNLWGYIDARDGAQAVRKALEYDAAGADVFIIANADTVMSRSNASLVAEGFPSVEARRDLGERDTLLSIDKARLLLGYEPQHSWREELAGRGG
jgi:nucleoside-diphosphate-sugar epimerase